MSTITTIYDNLVSSIQTILSSHKRLSNPYAIENNPDFLLEIGFGVGIGGATNTNRFANGFLSLDREFQITLTRRFFSLDNDPSAKATTEKQLFEDQILIIKDLESNSSINGTAMNTKFISDDGIRYLEKDNNEFMAITARFSVEYFESN